MDRTIEYIGRNLTKQKLEDLTRSVIDSYRNGNLAQLELYAQALPAGDAPAAGDGKALFFRIIKLVHPDRLPVLMEDFRRASEARDMPALRALSALLSVRRKAPEERAERADRYEYTPEETYGYDDIMRDYGVYEDTEAEGPPEDEEIDFIDALKLNTFGSLDIPISAFDLGQLEGSLDLSQYGIYDTTGLEYCRGLTELDLSRNNLENLYDLQDLVHLRELYLSDNRIDEIDYLAGLTDLEILDLENNEVEDIRVLLLLDHLKFVNLSRNPIRTRGVIEELNRRGVTVLE